MSELDGIDTPMKCVNFIRDNAPKYAQYVSDREHLERYIKTKKATLMNIKIEREHV